MCAILDTASDRTNETDAAMAPNAPAGRRRVESCRVAYDQDVEPRPDVS